MTLRRVSAYVDALLRGRRPPKFRADEADAAAIRAAIELRAAEQGASEPSDAFVEELQARLREHLKSDASILPAGEESDEPESEPDHREPLVFPRRRLLERAGIAASAALVAVAIDRLVQHAPEPTNAARGQQPLVPDSGRWETVAQAADVAPGSVTAFSTESVKGFLVSDGGAFRALSAVCTHQGCILHLNSAERRLDCPCHRAAFSLSGKALFHQFPGPLNPLPTLRVREANGTIQVLLPQSQLV